MLDASIFIIFAGCSFIIGVYLLYKYKKTNIKKFLWFGILLTFIVPGILILIALSYYTYISCYMPAALINGNISALIGLPLFVKERDKFINKFRNQVSQDVFNKITKKKK